MAGKYDENWLARAKIAKKAGEKVGLVQGSWDLFHLGHLRYILKARALCDFLIIAMDSDEKIRKRKGPTRPVIPEKERYEFIDLLGIADGIVVKRVDEPKWHLIKTVKPDVLVAIKETYSDDEIEALGKYCGEVAVLPRQAKTSTSDKIRQITIASRLKKANGIEEKVAKAATGMKRRINYSKEMPEPIPRLLKELRKSTDDVCPVAACCYWNGQWIYAASQIDFTIPEYDIQNRTELFYATVEHAEMRLLKKIGKAKTIDTAFYVTLFPCDRCMKVLADKGVKEIYYLEDHPERNWSKRSHALAEKKGIKTTCLAKTGDAAGSSAGNSTEKKSSVKERSSAKGKEENGD